jgi:hypothetical protein
MTELLHTFIDDVRLLLRERPADGPFHLKLAYDVFWHSTSYDARHPCPGDATATQASGSSVTAQLFGLEKIPPGGNDINLNECWLWAMCPVSAGTGLSRHVDELRNHWSGYRLWLPGGADRHPRSVLGR